MPTVVILVAAYLNLLHAQVCHGSTLIVNCKVWVAN